MTEIRKTPGDAKNVFNMYSVEDDLDPDYDAWFVNPPPEQIIPNIDHDADADEAIGFLKCGFRLFCTTALHPLDYAKTLIQLGYEPIAPRPGRTLFGVKRLMLPNIFQYAYHIGTVDGFAGCFRGLSAKLLGNMLSSYFSEKLVDRVGLLVYEKPKKKQNKHKRNKRSRTSEQENDDDEYMYEEFIASMKRNTAVHFVGVVISHPFHVISVRMMAQFIGRDQLYRGLWQSAKEIWKNEGIMGLYSGIVPRLIVDLGCMIITGTVTYFVSKYIVKNSTIRSNVDTITHFTVSSWLYPYHVVSTCMIVNGSSRLKAGNPPLMDHYYGWHDCYRRLLMAHEHKRGSSYFFRAVARTSATLSNSAAIAPYPALK